VLWLIDLAWLRSSRTRPVRALIYPEANQLKLLRIERRIAKRHPGQISDPRHPPIKRAFRRLARQDHLARLSTRKSRLFCVQPQAVHLHVRSVAAIAGLLENRLDILLEVNLYGGGEVLFRRPLWLCH